MSDLFPASLPCLADLIVDLIAEVRREIAACEYVFPNFVRLGLVSQANADRHMATMRAVLNTLVMLHQRQPGADHPTPQEG